MESDMTISIYRSAVTGAPTDRPAVFLGRPSLLSQSPRSLPPSLSLFYPRRIKLCIERYDIMKKDVKIIFDSRRCQIDR